MQPVPNGANAVPETKDLEGVTDSAKRPSRAGKSKQKKIAVLTSGGDSAGMNAAGLSHPSTAQERRNLS